jgi:DNA-binding response OmpR family regulator
MAKILIVEDDPFLALDLRHEVESLGYEVVGMAESADEALIASEENRADLALMDINIAGSMDGIQTARMLHAAHKIPVLFLTSASDDVTIARAAKVPLYGYLVKPFKRNELKAAMHVALQKSAADAAGESAHRTMSAAVGSLPEGVLTVTLDHQVQFMNLAAEQIVGCDLFAAKGKKLFDVLNLITSRQHRLPELNNAQDAAPAEEFGCSLTRQDRDPLLVDFAVTPLTDQGGQRTGFVVTLRNAAERLRSQAVEEILDEVHSFDLAPMPMIQLDGNGYIVRANAAMLHESGVHASVVIGRSLTGLSMDPDPRIAQVLFHKLLRADTSVAAVREGMMN